MDVRARGGLSSRSAIVGGNAYRVYSSSRSEMPLSGAAGLAGKPTQKLCSADRQGCDQALRDAMRGMRQGRQGSWPWWWRLFGW